LFGRVHGVPQVPTQPTGGMVVGTEIHALAEGDDET
jgi:hypothetical protein